MESSRGSRPRGPFIRIKVDHQTKSDSVDADIEVKASNSRSKLCSVGAADVVLRLIRVLFARTRAFDGRSYRLSGSFVGMAGQGRYITGETIQQIIRLLTSTEMTVSEIAERMSISRTTVLAINRRFQVRQYNGLRTRWLDANVSASTHGITKKKTG